MYQLANEIPGALIFFETYAQKANTVMVSNPTSANEIKEKIFSIKISKSIGYNETNFNVTRKCCAAFFEPLKYSYYQFWEESTQMI